MDGSALLERVREASETELDRLGSEKALLAATEARLETDAVLVTAAAVLTDAHETAAEWVSTAVSEAATEGIATTADRLGDAADRVRAELDDAVTADSGDLSAIDVPFLSLSGDSDAGRIGAVTIGLALVLDRLFLQSVSFFVNEADNARADLFRDLRGVTEDILAVGQDALDTLCVDDADWDEAAEAATSTIDAAYAEYVDRLDAMGFDPKPIC